MLETSRNGCKLEGESCNVEVMCRVRPLSQAEIIAGNEHVAIASQDSATISLKVCRALSHLCSLVIGTLFSLFYLRHQVVRKVSSTFSPGQSRTALQVRALL